MVNNNAKAREEYEIWKASKLANLPSFEQWLSKKARKLTPERIERSLAKLTARHAAEEKAARDRLSATHRPL